MGHPRPPASIERREYVYKPRSAVQPGGDVQTPETIEKMRLAGRIASGAAGGGQGDRAWRHDTPWSTVGETSIRAGGPSTIR